MHKLMVCGVAVISFLAVIGCGAESKITSFPTNEDLASLRSICLASVPLLARAPVVDNSSSVWVSVIHEVVGGDCSLSWIEQQTENITVKIKSSISVSLCEKDNELPIRPALLHDKPKYSNNQWCWKINS